MDNKSKPLVTILVLSYNNLLVSLNSEKEITKALDGLVNQDWPHIEILIQDDASTDNTPLIMKSYDKKYKRITFSQNESNLGIEKNIKSLLKKSSGKYILWACLDDFYYSNYISACVEKLERYNEASICQAAIRTLYADKEVIDSYTDIKCPISKRDNDALLDIAFQREGHIEISPALNPLIHGVTRAELSNIILSHPSFLYLEVSIPLFLILAGGLTTVPDVLFENSATIPFATRYPEAPYSKNVAKLSVLFFHLIKLFFLFLYFKVTGVLKADTKCIIAGWRQLFLFYFSRPLINRIKINIYNKILIKNPIILKMYNQLKELKNEK